MKVLSIGFLVLCAWIAFSTYIYVCKIKSLCHEPDATEIEAARPEEAVAQDTLAVPPPEAEMMIPEDLVIHFAFDRSDFKPDAQTDNYMLESKTYLEKHLQARLSFTGHTDAIGTDAYNQALGMRRARSVQNYFESKGLPMQNIVVESKGEKSPVDDNSTSAGRANNRRTEVTIIK